MQSYLERYLDGEYLDVWAELVSLGPSIRDEPLYSDALAVAREMMSRARNNVSILVERLKTLEYRFVWPDQAWVPPDSKQLAIVDRLEKSYGPLPLSVRVWCETVGIVNFTGAHPKLTRCHDYDWGGSEKLKGYGDPMVIYTTARGDLGLLPYYTDLAGSMEEQERMMEEMPPPYGLEIGLSAINKARQSGSGGVDMIVPNAAFDAPLLDPDHFWAGTLFVSYIRTCFNWGGFPGLRGSGLPDQQGDQAVSKSEIDFLTKDLMPL